MDRKKLPAADRKALGITPAQYREQRIKQLTKDAAWYQAAIKPSLLSAATMIPSGIIFQKPMVTVIGIVSLINAPYMQSKHKSTLEEVGKLIAQREVIAAKKEIKKEEPAQATE
jgi:hypothetical protein